MKKIYIKKEKSGREMDKWLGLEIMTFDVKNRKRKFNLFLLYLNRV